jgi:hypothetical protein
MTVTWNEMEHLLVTAEKMKKNESAKRTECAAVLSGQTYIL